MSASLSKSETNVNSINHELCQQALRTLLRYPLIHAQGKHQDEFRLIRRFQTELREWCSRYPAWVLKVDAEMARLFKTPAYPSSYHPARDEKSKDSFTRKRYILLCIALAVLERSERQTTLGELDKHLRSLGKADPVLASCGIDFEHDRAQRRDLVIVMRFLLHHNVIERISGDEADYINGTYDVLYTIHRPVLAAFLTTQRGPSMASSELNSLEERIDFIRSELSPEGKDARNQRIRTRIIRCLLDDTLIYLDDLNEEERDYLSSQRPHIVRILEDATGLSAEVRSEGIALVDSHGDATDMGMPEEGTEGHLALLMAEHLAQYHRETPGQSIRREDLVAFCADMRKRYGSYWRKDAREPGAESWLCKRTLERLQALKLLTKTEEGFLPRAAIARYRISAEPHTPDIQQKEAPPPPPPRQPDLFDLFS